MSLRKLVGFIGVGVGTIFNLVLGQNVKINETDYFTQLAVGVTLMAIGMAYWSFKPEIDRIVAKITYEERERKEHWTGLNNKIYKRLAKIVIRYDRHNTYGLYVPKDSEQDNPREQNIIYAIEDRTVLPVSKLPEPYYNWALKHLEHKKYKSIIDSWKKSLKLLDDYNKKTKKFEDILHDKIREEMKQNFSNFTEYDTKTESEGVYYLRKITERVTYQIGQAEEFSELLVDRNTHDSFGIFPRGQMPPFTVVLPLLAVRRPISVTHLLR